MDAGIKIYIPQAFRCFQGFSVLDLKESSSSKHLEILLEKSSCNGARLLMETLPIRRRDSKGRP